MGKLYHVIWNSIFVEISTHPFCFSYGRLTDWLPTLQIPNCDIALVYAWRGDNWGPPGNANEVKDNWKTIQTWFPNATEIIASTFEVTRYWIKNKC